MANFNPTLESGKIIWTVGGGMDGRYKNGGKNWAGPGLDTMDGGLEGHHQG